MLALPLLLACQEYGVTTNPKTPLEGETGSEDTEETDPPDSDPPDDSDPPQPVTCADVDLDWDWIAGPTFTEQADPLDGPGKPWFHPDYDTSSWSSVNLPHTDIPVGHDRTYRANFSLTPMPTDSIIEIELQSDDGIWVYLNQQLVGHWGGNWQQEGCVNENASCIQSQNVLPVPVNGFLKEGDNLIAARVSNPVEGAWFEIVPHCRDK